MRYAFPVPPNPAYPRDSDKGTGSPGMTLRDAFFIAALTGLTSDIHKSSSIWRTLVVRDAWAVADEALKLRGEV